MSLLSETQLRKPWRPPPGRPFEKLTPSIPVADELFRTRSVVGRSGRPIPLDVFIPQLEGELLYSLVRHLRPAASLEIGLANGVSAVYIAQALHDNGAGTHLAIDPFQSTDWEDAGLVTLRRAGLAAHVALDPRPSHWVLPDLEQAGRRVQFAFVDGNHLFDYVMADFLGLDRILDIGGLIAFDDSDWPAILRVIRFALTNRAYEVFEVGAAVEPPPTRPGRARRGLAALARRVPALRRVVRHDLAWPADALGIRGRFVVLRKTADDPRDGQSRHYVEFC